MDANQLIKALGDSAAAAKSPQEYCFLGIDWWGTCMSKAEWSGWMQAVFSVVAIVAAVLLTRWQLTVAKEETDRAKKAKNLELSSAALRICERVNRLARSMQRDLGSGKVDESWFVRLAGRWANLLACIDVLLAKDLDGDALLLVLDSRGFAAIALSACKTRSAGLTTSTGIATMIDVHSIKWNTAEARWRLRNLVRVRRAAAKI